MGMTHIEQEIDDFIKNIQHSHIAGGKTIEFLLKVGSEIRKRELHIERLTQEVENGKASY